MNLNLGEVTNDPNLKISVATAENSLERESRLRIEEANAAHQLRLEEANAAHQRRKEILLHSVTVGVISLVVLLCAWTILRKGFATEDGKLALALLTSIVTGLVGYATGRASK